MKHYLHTLALAALVGVMPASATIYSQYSGDKLHDNVGLTFNKKLEPKDAARVFAAFQAQARAQKLPTALAKLVTLETITRIGKRGSYPQHGIADKTLAYIGKGLKISLIKRTDGKHVINFTHYEADADSVTHALAPITMINPATKKPYFSLPSELLSKMPKEDQQRMKLVHRILNENVAAMAPVYHLSSKKYAKGDYMGKMINTPLIFFERQLQFFPAHFPSEEIAARKELGYLYNGYEELSKHPQVYYADEQYDGASPCSVMQVYFHPGGNVYKPSVVFSTKHFAKLEQEHVRTQLTEKADYLSYVQQQLHAMLKKQGVQPATSPDKAGLSAELQILIRWSNAMDHYMLRLMGEAGLVAPPNKNSRGHSTLAGSQRMKLKHLAPIMGKETIEPVTEQDKTKAQALAKRNKKKSDALMDKEHAPERRRLTRHMESGGTAENYDRNINP